MAYLRCRNPVEGGQSHAPPSSSLVGYSRRTCDVATLLKEARVMHHHAAVKRDIQLLPHRRKSQHCIDNQIKRNENLITKRRFVILYRTKLVQTWYIHSHGSQKGKNEKNSKFYKDALVMDIKLT